MRKAPTGPWAAHRAMAERLAADDVSRGAPSSYYDSIVAKSAAEHSIDTALAEALREHYGPVELRGSGRWPRFQPPGKRDADGYASVLGPDRAVFGVWGGERHLVVLSEDDEPRSFEDREKARQRREQREREQQARRLEDAKRHARAAEIAQRELHRLPYASPMHPYLVAKRLEPFSLRQKGEDLVAFLSDGHGVVGYQTISPTGEKRFLTGTAKQGAYWPLGHPNGSIAVCEGVGTAIAVHMGYHTAVAAALDAGNLLPVCLSLRERHPDVPIIVYADNDHGPDGDREDNVGIRYGREAAAAVGGHCTWPTARLGKAGTDFADLWLECPWYYDQEVTP